MNEPYQFGDYTYENSPILNDVKAGDEVEVTIRVTVTQVLPDKEVGGLHASGKLGVKGKYVSLLLPIRIIKEVKVLTNA